MGNDFRLDAGGSSRSHFHPKNNNVGQGWKTQSLPKHRRPLPHTTNTAQTTSPPAEGELHQKWRLRRACDHLFTRWELHHCLRETWSPRCLLTRFVSGEETDRIGANPVPTLLPRRSPPASPPRVSLIRVTHDSWVKPTLLRGIGLQFYHSFPFNAAKQQMPGLFMRPALWPPHSCRITPTRG